MPPKKNPSPDNCQVSGVTSVRRNKSLNELGFRLSAPAPVGNSRSPSVSNVQSTPVGELLPICGLPIIILNG